MKTAWNDICVWDRVWVFRVRPLSTGWRYTIGNWDRRTYLIMKLRPCAVNVCAVYYRHFFGSLLSALDGRSLARRWVLSVVRRAYSHCMVLLKLQCMTKAAAMHVFFRRPKHRSSFARDHYRPVRMVNVRCKYLRYSPSHLDNKLSVEYIFFLQLLASQYCLRMSTCFGVECCVGCGVCTCSF